MTSEIPERGVLTIATDKPVYVRMAVNLARSFRHWHATGDIGLTIVTDLPGEIPTDLGFVHVHAIEPGEFGRGLSPKLHLDRLARSPRTLFIDSDCLVAGRLDRVFERFAGRGVAVVGDKVSEGDFWGDVSETCRHFGVNSIVKFNGGIYYLEKEERSTRVFDLAREIESRYDELGLVRLRGMENEEILLSIAMSVHGEEPVPEDGTIKGDLLYYPSRIRFSVRRGVALLYNDPAAARHHPWWPLRRSEPTIVHFNGGFADEEVYKSQALILEKVQLHGWPGWLAEGFACVTTYLPGATKRHLKDWTRPIFHRFFGPRRIRSCERMR